LQINQASVANEYQKKEHVMKKTGVRMVVAAVVWSGLSSMPARAKGHAQTITLRAALMRFGLGLVLVGVGLAPGARADTVTDWNDVDNHPRRSVRGGMREDPGSSRSCRSQMIQKEARP
jgi:hypothetical protein